MGTDEVVKPGTILLEEEMDDKIIRVEDLEPLGPLDEVEGMSLSREAREVGRED
jgi:hypothetical protein